MENTISKINIEEIDYDIIDESAQSEISKLKKGILFNKISYDTSDNTINLMYDNRVVASISLASTFESLHERINIIEKTTSYALNDINDKLKTIGLE